MNIHNYFTNKTNDSGIIGNFGFKNCRDNDKFEQAPEIRDFLPVIAGSIAYITCKLIDTMETSTHTVFLGEVTGAEITNPNDSPMTYAYYHDVIKGKSPKNAPTFIEE